MAVTYKKTGDYTYKVGDHVRCIVAEAAVENYTADKAGGAGWQDGLEFIIEVYERGNEIGGRGIAWPTKDINGVTLTGNEIYTDWVELVLGDIHQMELDTDPPAKEEVTGVADEILGQEENIRLVRLAGEHNIPALLIGETGTGKTTMVKFIANMEDKKWVRFNLTGETTVDDFVGKFILRGGETIWQDGILLQAMKHGAWLVVDEINVALPEILFVLHSLLDDDKFVVVANNDGKIVKPHPDFRFFATMNPVSEYSGTKELNKAFQSRFGVIVNVQYPDPPTEALIIHTKTGINMTHASMMADVGLLLRHAKAEEKIFYTCSTRDLIQWATLALFTNVVTAFECTVVNKSNGDAEAIKQLATVVGTRYQDMESKGYTANATKIKQEWDKISADRKQIDEDRVDIAARKKAVKELADELLSDRNKSVKAIKTVKAKATK